MDFINQDMALPLVQRYLLAHDQLTFYQELRLNSTQYYFFKLISSFNNTTLMTKQHFHDWELLMKSLYGQKYSNKKDYLFQFQNQVQKLISSQTQIEKKEALENIKKKYVNLQFNYPAPAQAKKNILNPDESQKLARTLSDEQISLQAFIKKYSDNQTMLSKISQGITQVDRKIFLNSSKANILRIYLDFIQLGSEGDFAVQILKKYYLLKNKQKANQKVLFDYYSRLTIDQLNKLLHQVKDLMNSQEIYQKLLLKKYVNQIDKTTKDYKEMNQEELKARKNLLSQIKSFIKDYPQFIRKPLQKQIFDHQMILNYLLDDCDINMFLDYLRKPRNIDFPLLKSFREKLKVESYKHINYWQVLLGNGNFDQRKLINDYLEWFFLRGVDRNQFKDLLDSDFTNQLYYKTLLSSGSKIDCEEILGRNQLERLAKNKEITFFKNKKKFTLNQEVILKVKVQNIKKIKVTIFAVSKETYFLNAQRAPLNQIKLQYLKSELTKDVNIEYQTLYHQKIIQIQLDQLKNQPSDYIVELSGQQISSKAIISRGGIIFIPKTTLSGIKLNFYNEDGSALNIDMNKRNGLWIRNRFVEITQPQYLIPYGKSDQNLNLILVSNAFYAQKIDVFIPMQNYQFQGYFVYNTQEFLVGNKAKVLFQPKLYLHNKQASLRLIKEVSCSVRMENYLNIQSKHEFNNFELSYQNQSVFEIPIQSYVKTIYFEFKGEIEKMNGKKQTVQHNQKITISLQDQNYQKKYFLYLSHSNKGYSLYYLGKNGQPKQNCCLNITINHFLYREPFKTNLFTDQEGKVFLGKLSQVSSINANVKGSSDSQGLTRNWNLQNKRQTAHCLPSSICMIEKQRITIPVSSEFNLQKDCFILEKKNGQTIKSLKQKLKVKNSRLIIEGFSQGFYELFLKDILKKITIEVLEGDYWKQSKQIYYLPRSKKLIQKNLKLDQFISIKNIFTSEEQKENFVKIKVSLNIPEQLSNEQMNQIRLHCIAYNFVPLDENHHVNNLKSMLRSKNCLNYFFEQKYSEFFSNKKIGDQHAYVLARQKAQKYIGNNLDKPLILLKRIELRQTTFQTQQLSEQQNFKEKNINRLMQKSKLMARGMGGKMHGSLSVIQSQQIMSMFLSKSAQIRENLHGKSYQFQIPSRFQSIQLILCSMNSVIGITQPLREIPIQKFDNRYEGLPQTGKDSGWTIQRDVRKLFQKQKLSLNKGIEWIAVGPQNIIEYARNKNLVIWKWISEWFSYSHQQKLKVYDQFCCHQMNLFLFRQDSEFFENVVKPFISNKLQKDFIDEYLLGREEKITTEWTKVENLNYLQKVLLVDCINKKSKDRARNLGTTLKMQNEGYENYKKCFDQILTSKQKDQIKQEKEKGKKNKKKKSERKMDQQMECQMDCLMAMPKSRMIPMSNMLTCNYQLQQQCNQLEDQQYQFMERQANKQSYSKGFQQLEQPKEYAERTYFNCKHKSDYQLTSCNFWYDVSQWITSEHPSSALLTDSFMFLKQPHEFSLVLSFFHKQLKPKYLLKNEGKNIIIQAETPVMIYAKQIKEVPIKTIPGIFLNQRFFDPSNEFDYDEEGMKIQRDQIQFLVGMTYACSTVITNTTCNNLELQVLVDPPEGSIRLGTTENTLIKTRLINSFTTIKEVIYFYFPREGKFRVSPANVSFNGKILAKAKEGFLKVSKQLQQIKLESFADILKSGSEDDIVEFMVTKNILDKRFFDITQIYFYLKKKDFFQKVMRILRQKGIFDNTVWQFSFLHQDYQGIIEYFNANPFIFKNLIGSLTVQNFSVDKFKAFQYHPLFSNRAHKFMNQDKSTILNNQFKQKYSEFLRHMILTKKLNPGHYLTFAYYLILQDRISEAIKMKEVAKTKFDMKQPHYPQLQLDYIDCFLDMFVGYPNFVLARDICQKYLQYPVLSWRKLFKNVHQKLNYHDELIVQKKQPLNFDITAEYNSQQLLVKVPKGHFLKVDFYYINLQLLFSSNPFVEYPQLRSIFPNQTLYIKQKQQVIERPTNQPLFCCLSTSENVSIVLNGTKQSGKFGQFLWDGGDLVVQILQDEAKVRIWHDNKVMSGIYVKVFVRQKGNVRFWRDGYSDIVGVFSYLGQKMSEIERIAILVVSQFGSLIKYTNKPKMEGSY